MALPQELRLDDELAAFAAKEDEPDAPSAGVDAYTYWKSAVDRHAAHLARLHTRLTNVERKVTALLESVRRDIEAGQPSVSLDELIDYYTEVEKGLAQDSLPVISESKRRKKELFSLPVSVADRSRALLVYDQAIRLHTRMLELIRDLRWQLMALRAILEANQNGPTFSDPQELEAYLDKL